MEQRRPEALRALRNTRTLEAYRARMGAAQNAAMPFLALPFLLNPALGLPLLKLALRHMPPLAAATGALVWFALAAASLVVGLRRRSKTLREHPFLEA
jgi:hypothetical protein